MLVNNAWLSINCGCSKDVFSQVDRARVCHHQSYQSTTLIMTFQIVPPSSHRDQVASDAFGVPSESVPTLPDTLRTAQGPLNVALAINHRHPLEARVAGWDQTQRDTQMEMYRRVFGAGVPIKHQMELAIIDNEFTPMSLLNLHRDVVLGKDTEIDWEDVYPATSSAVAGFHSAMEKKMGM